MENATNTEVLKKCETLSKRSEELKYKKKTEEDKVFKASVFKAIRNQIIYMKKDYPDMAKLYTEQIKILIPDFEV